ncbi:MAG: leucine-rich repeat domain-containing protein [Christensenellaceae bacterium]|jgi:hypothetical protein|nr:leucine-rich repeat domain-containing protein [Christensenellaceae bacterium]
MYNDKGIWEKTTVFSYENKHNRRVKYAICIAIVALTLTMLIVFVGCRTNKPTIKDVCLKQGSFSASYVIGSTPASDAKLILKRSDGSEKIVDVTLDMISGFDTNTPGTKTVVITYNEHKVEFEITVVDKLNAISIKDKQAKQYYGVGERFSDGDVRLSLDWVCGDDLEIPITNEMLVDWNTSTIGHQSIEISYCGLKTSFDIIVSGNIFSSTLIETGDSKYYTGDSFMGATLKLLGFSGIYIERIIGDNLLIGFDTTTSGEKHVKIEYSFGEDSNSPAVVYTHNMIIDVLEDTLESIETTADFKREYFVGEELTTCEIIARYASGKSIRVPITTTMITNFSTIKSAKLTVVINYCGMSIERDISVIELCGIEIDSFKYKYEIGDTAISGSIWAIYSDTVTITKRRIILTNSMVNGFSTARKGYYSVELVYGGYKISSYIYVGLDIDYIETDIQSLLVYEKDSEFLLGPLLIVHFDDATFPAQEIAITNDMFDSKFDTSMPGRKTYTIKFLDFSVLIEICVSGVINDGDYDLLYLDEKYDILVPQELLPAGVDDFEFSFGYMIIKHTGKSSDVTIPVEYNNTPIVCVAKNIFKNSFGIESLTIPFIGFSHSNQFDLKYFFDYDGIDYSHRSTLEKVTIMQGMIKEIPSFAFYNWFQLTQIDMPEGIKKIGNSAFGQCTALPTMTLPSTITTIGELAFEYCPVALTLNSKDVILLGAPIFKSITEFEVCVAAIIVDDNLINLYQASPYWCDVSEYMISKADISYVDNSCIVKNNECLVRYFGSSTNLVINAAIKQIGRFAFFGNNQIITVSLQNGVEKIECFAFADSNLAHINLPNTLISIASYAFACPNLTVINIPSSVKVLESLSICSFSNNFSVILNGPPIDIPSNAIMSVNMILVPDMYVNEYMLDATWSKWALKIYSLSIVDRDGFIVDNSGILYGYVGNDSIVTIPDSVTTIDASVFANKIALTCVIFSKTVQSVETYAFANCMNLSSIDLGNIKSIASYAFFNCNMSDIYIPVSIESIEAYAFYRCYNLETIYVYKSSTEIASFVSDWNFIDHNPLNWYASVVYID